MKRYSSFYFSALLIITSYITQITGEPAETGIIEEESPVSSEESPGSMSNDTIENWRGAPLSKGEGCNVILR